MFPGSRYPDWLSGSAYLLDRDTAGDLYQAALNTPLFHIEDVFLTGILASKVFRNIKQDIFTFSSQNNIWSRLGSHLQTM